ncbi:hypothetical protein ACQPZJ_34705 [Actinoplanes sp. CA-054009]
MRNPIRKIATAAGLGLGALALVATPALASGPAYATDTGEVYLELPGTVPGAAHIWRVSGDHYTIVVADKSPTDGQRFCIRIHATNGNKPVYCDSNGTAAAQHHQIYYNWIHADWVVGSTIRPWF